MMTNILLFKTSLENNRKAKVVNPILQKYPFIIDWSVDVEDIDHVLRIETVGDLSEREVIRLMNGYGIFCEPLVD